MAVAVLTPSSSRESIQQRGREGVRATSVRPHVAGSDNEETDETLDLQRFFKPSDGLEPSTPSLP
ncbi:MAG TPA: hypothetical protein VLV16_08215, partial [Gemmatimonadales bacterium]|nr:hypothetical protein [Gemmatimonadales bacterium]